MEQNWRHWRVCRRIGLIQRWTPLSWPSCTRACSRVSRPMSTPTGPLSAVGLIPPMFLCCNSYLRALLMFLARVPGAAATSQGRGKQQGGRGRRERWQGGGQERNKLHLSPMCKYLIIWCCGLIIINSVVFSDLDGSGSCYTCVRIWLSKYFL